MCRLCNHEGMGEIMLAAIIIVIALILGMWVYLHCIRKKQLEEFENLKRKHEKYLKEQKRQKDFEEWRKGYEERKQKKQKKSSP